MTDYVIFISGHGHINPKQNHTFNNFNVKFLYHKPSSII